jgi:hypothetical protein
MIRKMPRLNYNRNKPFRSRKMKIRKKIGGKLGKPK